MDVEPLLSVVRGMPTDEELAAVLTIIAARSTTADAQNRTAEISAWTRSARPSMAPASWRASGLPR
jgi:hypothetical protein